MWNSTQLYIKVIDEGCNRAHLCYAFVRSAIDMFVPKRDISCMCMLYCSFIGFNSGFQPLQHKKKMIKYLNKNILTIAFTRLR